VVPFDQIYWNSGLPIADPGEYVTSTTKVAKIGQTANRNPDSAFSFPGGNTTDQQVDEWFGLKSNTITVNNIFHGIHVTDPLTISPDKPYKGARLVLKRKTFIYYDFDAAEAPGGDCENFDRTEKETLQFGFQHIKVKKNSVVQRPAEHGTLASASADTQTRFGDTDPKYNKYTYSAYSFDGTVGTTVLTFYGDYQDYDTNPGGSPDWYADPPHYIINKDFLLLIDGTLYTISSITRTGTYAGGYTYSINTNEDLVSTYTKEEDFVIWEKRGSPRVDSVVHVVDTDATTDGTLNASSDSDFNDYNGDGMSESTWGMLPYKYDELDIVENLSEYVPAFENVDESTFEPWLGPSYSASVADGIDGGFGSDPPGTADTRTMSYRYVPPGGTSVGGSLVYHRNLSFVSQAAWPQYENDIAALTDTPGGTRSGGIIGNRSTAPGSAVYPGIPSNAAWDMVAEASRENRVDEANVNAQSNRNKGKYPYVLGDAGFYAALDQNDPPVLGADDPLDYEDPHYLTIWETDEIITPGDTYEVTLSGPLSANSQNLCDGATEDRTTREEFTLVLIAK
jgi:hypothetical protein